MKGKEKENQRQNAVSSAKQEKEKHRQMCKELSGSSHEELCIAVIQSAYEAFPKNVSKDLATTIVTQMMQEMAPKDPMEAMLCAQIIGLDAQGMQYLARAESDGNWLCHTEAAINMGIKLLRLKNETIETLMRYRKKGEQRVVVQHINVNDDAKAIIGDINTTNERGG